MEVSPQTIREVEFREKLRGYHQDDVDEFLERVAAGVELLQERLRQATERAVRAEQQVAEGREDDESLRRTLVLAQRTADLAVREAKEEAARIVAAAEAQAASTMADATQAADRLVTQAYERLSTDVERLGAVREQLRADAVNLARYLDEQRTQAKTLLADAARRLDDVVPPPAPLPPLHDIDVAGMAAASEWGEEGADGDAHTGGDHDSGRRRRRS